MRTDSQARAALRIEAIQALLGLTERYSTRWWDTLDALHDLGVTTDEIDIAERIEA